MNVNYTWQRISVSKSKSLDTELQLRHIVEKVWFVREGIDEQNNKSDVRQVVDLPPPDPTNFKRLQEATKKDLESWIESALGSERLKEIDDTIAKKLEEIRARKQLFKDK